jgi:DNA-binding MarR family transcriptional regulator
VAKYLVRKASSSGRTPSTPRTLRRRAQTELRLLTTEIDGVDQRAAARLGLNRTDLRCLGVLAGTGAMTPSELARALGLTSGGLSIALDRLERAGYVNRSPHPEDRRRVVVEVTGLTQRLGAEVFGGLSARVEKALRGYGGVELFVINDFLRRIRIAIREDAGEFDRGMERRPQAGE